MIGSDCETCQHFIYRFGGELSYVGGVFSLPVCITESFQKKITCKRSNVHDESVTIDKYMSERSSVLAKRFTFHSNNYMEILHI